MRALKKTLRVLLALTLGLVVLASLGLIGGYFYVRSTRGRELVLRIAREKLTPLFPGGMKLGRIEGDLTEGITLYDVELDDAEGEVAIKVRRLDLRYRLLPLLTGNIVVTSIEGDGALVVSRPLANGRDNLATMVITKPHTGPRTTRIPVAIDVERIDLQGRFVRLPRKTTIAHAPRDEDVRLTLHGSASISRALTLRVGGLAIELQHPGRGKIEAHGTIDLGSERALRNVVALVEADAYELRRRVAGIELRGPMKVEVSADGAFHDLRFAVGILAPQHGLRVAGKVRLRADRVGAEMLEVDAPFAKLRAHGEYRYDGKLELATTGRVSDLSKLALFGAPPMAGSAELRAQIARDRNLTLTVSATGTDLVIAGNRVRSFGLDLDSKAALGHLHARGRGLTLGGVALRSMKIDGDSTTTETTLAIIAEGGEKNSADIRIVGKPRMSANEVVGADAEIRAMHFGIGGNHWNQSHPSKIAIDLEHAAVDVQRIDLASEEQSLALRARFHQRTIDEAFFELKHFDFQRMSALLSPGHVLPHTDLYVVATGSGPLADPEVTGKISGEAHGRGGKDFIHAAGEAGAHLLHGRLTGKTFITIGGQKVSAHVDMPLPLRPRAPIEISMDASVLLSPTFSELLVPKLIQFQPLVMFTLSGTITAKLRLTGTTSDPELHATARFANWEASGAHGAIGLSADYRGRELGGSLTCNFSSLPAGGGTGGGIIEATARLPIDLPAFLTGGNQELLPRSAPLHALINLKHVGIDHLPFHAFNITPPLQHGTLEGSIEVGGTAKLPQATVQLSAAGFDAVSTGINGIDAKIAAKLEGAALTSDTMISLGRGDAVRVHASIDGGRERNPATADWWHAPLLIEGITEHFDLSKLGLAVGLAGQLRGSAKITGQLARPTFGLGYDIDGFALGRTVFRRVQASASLKDGVAQASFTAEQSAGARLDVQAKVPLGGGKLEGLIHAKGFVLDVQGDRLPVVRTLRGVLDADLRFSGTKDAPIAKGLLELKQGELRIPALAMDYRNIDARIAIDEKQLRVDRIRFLAGAQGEAELTGRASMSSFVPNAVTAKLVLRQFPFQQRGVGVYLDAEVEASGSRNKEGVLGGRIHVKSGEARLPAFTQTRVLLPTGGLEDVRVVEHRSKDGTPKYSSGLRLGANFDGPFVIHGKEVNAVARGGLNLDLRGARPVLHGALRLDGRESWVELFGRRYDLERGRISFDGAEEPLLDIRISRRTPSATVGVNVSGRATKPSLEFWSSPPIFDTTQVVGIILSGDPASNGVTPEGLQKQAAGAISTLLVRSIKDNFLPELPIDVFRLDANDSNGGATGSQIELGKYLTDALYVGYAYQIGVGRVGGHRLNTNEARLNYRLKPSWQVEANVGDAGVGGLDLYWSYRPR